MKTKDISEADATKLRLIREVPFVLQRPIDRIIETAVDWAAVEYGVDRYLTAVIEGIDRIKLVRDRFKLSGPIGELRKKPREKRV